MANWYVSWPAYIAMPTWASIGAGASVSLGAFCRQSGAPVFIAWSGLGSGGSDVSVLNVGATSFNMSLPSGFTAWDSSGSTTYDPATVGSNITLSGGNLTATHSSSGTWNSARSTTSKTSGKFYFEILCSTLSGTPDQIFGLCNATESMNSYLGVDTNGDGWESQGAGQNNGNSGSTLSWQGVAASGYVGIAVDVTNRLMWIRTSANGNWNNNTVANPVTGVAGAPVGPILLYATERAFKVTTAGTLGSVEPTWNLNDGATTSESGHGGTAVWTEVAGHETSQSAGNWTAPIPRLGQMPGSSFAIGSLSFASGDQVFVSNDHGEWNTGGGTINQGGVEGVKVYSVSRTGASLPPTSTDLLRGAFVYTVANTTLAAVAVDGYWWGVDFFTFGSLRIGNSGYANTEFENGSFQLPLNNGTISINDGNGGVVFNNTTVHFSNASSGLVFNSPFEWKNTASAVQGTTPTALFSGGATLNGKVLIHGVDLSAETGILFSVSGYFGSDVILRDCKLGVGVVLTTSHITGGWSLGAYGNAQLIVDNCDDSTGNTNYRMMRVTSGGTVMSQTNVVRTGGNTDGVTTFAWQLINSNGNILGNAACVANATRFPEIQQRFPEGSQSTGTPETLTIYGCSGAAAQPTNGNTWMEVDYLGSSASPIATTLSSRVATPLTAGTNLTADTSNWTSGVAARQNSHAYTVGQFMVPSSNSGRVFVCTVAGTSASSLPGGYATAVDGGTVVDGGTCTFMAMWRWSIALTFTPLVAGTIKCVVRSLLGTGILSDCVIIDPAFVLSP